MKFSAVIFGLAFLLTLNTAFSLQYVPRVNILDNHHVQHKQG